MDMSYAEIVTCIAVLNGCHLKYEKISSKIQNDRDREYFETIFGLEDALTKLLSTTSDHDTMIIEMKDEINNFLRWKETTAM
jgi:hypothetical protein